MSVHVAGEISRFFGYLHLPTTLNLDAIHYTGAPVYGSPGFVPDGVARWGLSPVALPEATSALRLPLDDEVASSKLPLRLPLAQVQLPAASVTMPFLPAGPPSPLPTISFGEPVVTFAKATPLDPTVIYMLGQTGGSAFWLTQRNDLRDNDVVVDQLIDVDDLPLPPDVARAIEGLIEQALALVPIDVGPRTGTIGGLTQERHSGNDGAETLLPAGNTGAHSASAVAANGTHQNGEMIVGVGATQKEQVEDLRDAIESILGEGEIGAPRATVRAPVPAETDGEPTAFGPTGGAAQIVSAGGNEAANVAAVYDLGDAFGSRIILGDYYEKNVIVQVNVLGWSGSAIPTPADLAAAVVPSASSLTNEASFRSDPGLLYGSIATGFPGATKWKVDYVHGDFIDVTTLIQRNTLYDNDIAAPAQSLSYSVATLGENDQINILNLVELGKSYDLIIIAGDYVKYNAIFQFNIVLDDAHTSDGNTLLNDAAIIGSGGNTHTPITANAAALAEAIGNQSPQIDHAWTIGLPGNGNDTLEILYVTGDYYSYNILVQTNIVADVDAITPAEAAGSDTLDQASYSGANTVANVALIYDADSQSAYQMLAGEAYEDNFLVQANLILDADDEEEETGDDDDDNDQSLIGVVAALSIEGQSQSGRGDADADADGGATGSIDMLSSMLH
jgi:hypothetical protein